MSSVGFWIFAGILTGRSSPPTFRLFRLLLPMNSTLVQLALRSGGRGKSHLASRVRWCCSDILLHFRLSSWPSSRRHPRPARQERRLVGAIDFAFSESEAPMAATTIKPTADNTPSSSSPGCSGSHRFCRSCFSRAPDSETAQSRVHSDSVSPGKRWPTSRRRHRSGENRGDDAARNGR